MLVKEVMLQPLTIDIDSDVRFAGEMMAQHRRDTLVVVKNKHPIGIITDSDLIKKIIAKNEKPSSLKVKDVMSKPLVIIDAEQNILDAVRKIKKSNIKRLIVCEKGNLVGVLTLSDIARHSPEVIDLLEYKLKMRDAEPTIKEEATSGICDSCGNYSGNLRASDEAWLCEECREEKEE